MSNNFKTPRKSKQAGRGDASSFKDGELPGKWSPLHPRNALISRVLAGFFLLCLIAVCALPFTPWFAPLKTYFMDKIRLTKIASRNGPITIVKEVIREVPAPPTPLPSNFIPRKEVDVATLYNGITIETQLQTTEGNFATIERLDKDAFKVDFKLNVRVPKANCSVAELGRVNPHLPKMLPGLPDLLANGKISGFYHKLYENKVNSVEKNLTRLNKVLDRHNFFDCETILELQHPKSKRLALLIQSDMDVVADGSDGDRMPTMESSIYSSDFYQPFTSYEWAKQDAKSPNPLLSRWLSKYEALKKEASGKTLTTARKAELKAQMQHMDAEITQMKKRSSLIAEKDPFIVISLLFKDYARTMPEAPSIGDYCAVIFDKTIYPAICGDYGPSMKMGEASLLLAKKINDKATPYVRGSDELKVTYLIFPGTAKRPFAAPNLDEWYERIDGYLKEIGGLGDGYSLYKWENQFPTKPIPAPTATDALVAAPAASPTAPQAGTVMPKPPEAPAANPAAAPDPTGVNKP